MVCQKKGTSWLIVPLFVLFLLLVSFPSNLLAQSPPDTITAFDSAIRINQDTSLTIAETIDYQTTEPKHGIYRDLPIKYDRDGRVYTATISDISVADARGQPVEFTLDRDGRFLTLKIGSPHETFIGDKSYHLTYTVNNALARFPTHDELYWDITGDGWRLPLLTTTATVTSPFASITQATCYSGPTGSNDGLCRLEISSVSAQLVYDHPVAYNDNVTVVLALERPNGLIFPSTLDRFKKYLFDNAFLLFIPLPLLLAYMLWYYRGRDWESVSGNIFNLDPDQPQRLRPVLVPKRVPFVYEPLADLTPAQAGAILDEKVNDRDLVADLIDLARRQVLKIESEKKGGFLTSSTEYTFTKLKQPGTLPSHQRYLFDQLFQTGESVTLSSLKGTFYSTMASLRRQIDESLTHQRLYTAQPLTSRAFGLGLVIVTNIVVFKLIAPSLQLLGSPWLYLLFLLQGLGGLFFGFNLTQKTVVGHNLMLQARGLKATIKSGQWREEIKEKHLFIEEVLPFAIAFGVIDTLAKDMAALNLKPPDYVSPVILSSTDWSSHLSGFTAAAASNLGHNPSSSQWSGGSGFSGGSSGGGGGGGGGGSW